MPRASIWRRSMMPHSARRATGIPKFVSPSDPAAQWTGALKGHAFFAYATNYLIDLDHAIIVDVEATPARVSSGNCSLTEWRTAAQIERREDHV